MLLAGNASVPFGGDVNAKGAPSSLCSQVTESGDVDEGGGDRDRDRDGDEGFIGLRRKLPLLSNGQPTVELQLVTSPCKPLFERESVGCEGGGSVGWKG